MIMQYRNHPSVILWDVRISDSDDEDALYYKTNRLARELDVYRQTGGVRDFAGSRFFEDVYLYDDMGQDAGSVSINSENICQDISKACVLSGHGSLAKNDHKDAGTEASVFWLMQQAKIWKAIEGNDSIAGSLAPKMTDYPISRRYSGGNGLIQTGVMDWFRNPKLAAALFKSQREDEPVCTAVPPVGDQLIILTNADHILLYCNEQLIDEFYPDENEFRDLVHPPVFIDHLSDILHTKQNQNALFSKCHAVTWKIEAVKENEVIAETCIGPAPEAKLQIMTDRQKLVEENSYDAATVHIEAVSESGQHLYEYETPLVLKTEGDIELIGPSVIMMQGGFAGTYVRSVGRKGSGRLFIQDGHGEAVIDFSVEV